MCEEERKRGESDAGAEMRIPGNEEAKVREGARAERRDEKLDLQIRLDYYEIARLPVSGAQPPPRYTLTIPPWEILRPARNGRSARA